MSSLDRVLAALVAYVGAAAVAGGRRGPTVCPYRLLTRRPCPVCGLTRALGRASRLDLAGARAHHAAGPVVLVVVLSAALVRLGTRRRDRGGFADPIGVLHRIVSGWTPG
jgi:hypothetical protein